MNSSGELAFLTTGYLLNASSAGPVAAHTKSGPRMPGVPEIAQPLGDVPTHIFQDDVVPARAGLRPSLTD